MSYAFDYQLEWSLTGGNVESASLGLLVVIEGSQLDPQTAGAYFGLGQPSAANLGAIVGLNECTAANYARKTLAGVSVSVNTSTSPHRAQVTFNPVEYTPAVAGMTPPAIGAVIFINGASEALRFPLWYLNGAGFPWAGGSDLYFIPPVGGSIRLESR